jgi:hypothetical protein
MRFITKATLIGCMAVGVMSLVPVASASAAECPGTTEGGGIALCSEGKEQKEGTFAFTGQQKAGTLTDPFNVQSWTNPEFECKGSAKLSKGSLVAKSGKLELTGLYVEFEKCAITSSDSADCELASPSILVVGGTGSGSGPGLKSTVSSTAELWLKSGAANYRWTSYTIRGRENRECDQAYESNQVKGEAKCLLPESTVEAVTHVLKCEKKSNELQSSAGTVDFELTAELKLASGKKWSLQKI